MNEQLKQRAIRANPSSQQIYDVAESWPYNCAAWSGEDLAEFQRIIVLEVLETIARAPVLHCCGTTYDLGVTQCTQQKILNAVVNQFDFKYKVHEERVKTPTFPLTKTTRDLI